ncbi:uncharacterized protein EDB91DRAFT_1079667 [Suillus paluster]|uniref:uncharacterized protein n=1 Tax=Suillus paluster TaxID=48578 RepID=UPI001B874223|nr:uncharacterized protein EDB91DRAFT_1079667 [Suillus paluster]KAG1747026.1 hypothetical protein EDB91DRAFT_1079667 [Suillus paluster]
MEPKPASYHFGSHNPNMFLHPLKSCRVASCKTPCRVGWMSLIQQYPPSTRSAGWCPEPFVCGRYEPERDWFQVLSADWEGWLKMTNPIMKGLYGNTPDPIKHPLDWQCILLESNLSRNPPAPMMESNLASWQLCLETMIKELDKRQPGSSPEVPMEVDPLTIQPSLFKRPHNLHLILINWSPGNIRFHPGVIHPRGQALLAMQPGQPIASGSLSGNVSEPNVPPAPSSNSEGLSFSEYNSWGGWLTPVAALSKSELQEPIEEGVEIWETIRKRATANNKINNC